MTDSSKKSMGMGIALAISFFVVLALIFSPIFGDGKNGLVFSDDLFNKLSKGSSYFIPKVSSSNKKFMGRTFSVSLKMDEEGDNPGDAEKRAKLSAKLFALAEARAELNGPILKVEGDLGKVLEAALQDSDVMYRNQGAKLKGKYQVEDEQKMFRQWHDVLTKMNKEFAKEKKIEEANITAEVMKKAVETAYNYYGVEAQNVADKALLMTGLLLFYVAYTMWWGFAIYYIFEGIGLTMKKAKVKKEV